MCRFKSDGVGATVKSFRYLTLGDENALTKAIENIGPISIAIDASQQSFQFYSNGIYFEPNCKPTSLNHAVTAVGYGSQGNGLDYYIVKNSWGDTWGENGRNFKILVWFNLKSIIFKALFLWLETKIIIVVLLLKLFIL